MKYFQKRACSSIKYLAKSTFLSMIDNYDYQTKAGSTNNDPNYTPSHTKQFFIRLDNESIPWYISSFDPVSGMVCVVVENPKGVQVISVGVQKASSYI